MLADIWEVAQGPHIQFDAGMKFELQMVTLRMEEPRTG